MSLTETIAKDIVHSMSKEERERFVDLMLDEFFSTMSLEDKKEMMNRFLPKIVEEMMEGMSSQDRKAVIDELMPIIEGALHDSEKKEKGGHGSHRGD